MAGRFQNESGDADWAPPRIEVHGKLGRSRDLAVQDYRDLAPVAAAHGLVAKQPMLCQRCHIGTRHPSTIYDNLSIQSRSVRVVSRGCVNCHSQIHGSNHPSGQTFTR